MKSKVWLLLISAAPIFAVCFAASSGSWATDSNPPQAGASSDGQTIVAQATQAGTGGASQTTGAQTAAGSGPAAAPDARVPVTEVTVKAEKEKQAQGTAAETPGGFLERKQNETSTQNTVTRQGISLFGGPGQTNMLQALQMLPSVNFESSDPYGFGFSPISMRIRGQQAISLGTMIEGIPVWAIQQPGPRLDTFDLENFQSITLYPGAMPSDKGLGGMNTAGALDIGILKPADTFGAVVKQTVGSFDLMRTYARVDSGKLATGTAFFISGSTTDADKWKGEGGAPQYRDHLSFGITQEFSSIVKAELYCDYNNQNLYSYKALTYAQASDLPVYNRLDYNPLLTGTPKLDVNWSGYNYTEQKDFNTMGILSIAPTDKTSITFRPYYWYEDKPAWAGITSIPGISGTTYGVDTWENKFNRYGAVTEFKTLLSGATLKVGYWYESFNLTTVDYYYKLLTGGGLAYNRTLDPTPNGRGIINSPYIRVQRDFFKDLHIDAGLRYMDLKTPGETALLSYTAPSPIYNYNAISHQAWLPYFGASYSLTPETSIYGNYGRNYAFPQSWPNLLSNYISSLSSYQKAGENIQYLANQIKMGTSDNFELGTRYNNKRFSLVGDLFYSAYQNKLFSIYDPSSGQSISQSIGQERIYGAEFLGSVSIMEHLKAFGSISYNKSQIDSNIPTGATTIVYAKGKEAPDTPPILAKVAATYDLFGVHITPMERYVDARYGDVLNVQRVSPYWVTDLNVMYKLPQFFSPVLKEMTVSASMLNVFNTRYISAITAFDSSQSGSYMVGAPRAYAFTFMARF
jgi:iron complex outermembrane receptor protein